MPAMDLPDLARCAPDVHPATMQAIIAPESGGNPFVIGVNGPNRKAFFPGTRAEAVALAAKLLAAGKNIDIGLAQINSANLPALRLTLDAAFDPCESVRAGASILRTNYEREAQKGGSEQEILQRAISAYNTGNGRDGFRNGYVAKVLAAAPSEGSRYVVPRLVGTSAGNQTPIPHHEPTGPSGPALDVFIQAKPATSSATAWDVFSDSKRGASE